MLREQWKVTFQGRNTNTLGIHNINIADNSIYFCHFSTLMGYFRRGTSVITRIDFEGNSQDFLSFTDAHIQALLAIGGYFIVVISEEKNEKYSLLCCYNRSGTKVWEKEITHVCSSAYRIIKINDENFIVYYDQILTLYTLQGIKIWEKSINTYNPPSFFKWDAEYWGLFTAVNAYKFNILGDFIKIPIDYSAERYNIVHFDGNNFYLLTNNRPKKIIKISKKCEIVWVYSFEGEDEFASKFYVSEDMLFVAGGDIYLFNAMVGSLERIKNTRHVKFMLRKQNILYLFLFDQICIYDIDRDESCLYDVNEIIDYAIIHENMLVVVTARETNVISLQKVGRKTDRDEKQKTNIRTYRKSAIAVEL